MEHAFRAVARTIDAVRPSNPLRSFEGVGRPAIATLFVLMLAQHVWAHGFKVGDIAIEHPWSRATPDGAKVAAGYLVISNEGSTPDRLIAASGEIAGRTQIHEMSVDADGVMKMNEIPGGLEIPAGGEVDLKPGSFHIMFMDLKAPAVQGRTFRGTLTFEKAGAVDVEYMVDAVGGDAGHDDTTMGAGN